MRLTQKKLDKTLKQMDYIIKLYKKKYSKVEKRDWRTYEQRLAYRIKTAAKELEPIIEEAYSSIEMAKEETRGRPRDITVPKKILILLLKEIFQLSNRKMANFLMFFTVLSGIDTSYKTVERIYSDPIVRMTIHNMYAILVKKKGIEDADLTGDGTGYSLTIIKHYRNVSGKKGVKEGKKTEKGRKLFAYSFGLMDIDTRMYVGYGTSLKSEKEAYKRAILMASTMGITARSIRLDKYYSNRTILKDFPDAKIYIIPKKNATIRGPKEWKEILVRFIEDIFSYLSEYYQRNNSESGFSVDKRMCGWKVWQKREERIDTCLLCKGIWHNMMLIG